MTENGNAFRPQIPWAWDPTKPATGNPARQGDLAVDRSALFLTVARWLSLVVILLVPWPYACIPTWTRFWLSLSYSIVAVIWLCGLMAKLQPPKVPWMVVMCVAMLILQGGCLIINAQYSYDRLHLRFIPLARGLSSQWVPGALDTLESVPQTLNIAGLLAFLCVLIDAARDALWCRRILRTVLFGGLTVVVYGLLQRMLRQPLLLWSDSALQHNLFGPFYYHGNAGAFVNLLLPLSIGYAVEAFQMPDSHFQRAISLGALLLILAAQVAIASKAATLIALALLLLSGWVSLRILARGQRFRSSVAIYQGIAVIGVALAGVLLFGIERSVQRWSEWRTMASIANPRLVAWHVCTRMIPDAGLWGIGPGNFIIAFPHYTQGVTNFLGVWEHAHNDYLETCIEWGWLGAVFWAALVGGGVVRGWSRLHRNLGRGSEAQSARVFALISILGLLVHAVVDFPTQVPAIAVFACASLAVLWSAPEILEKSATEGSEPENR